MSKSDHLREPVEHIDISRIDASTIVDMMARMSTSARDLARGARLYVEMVRDPDCTIILCLAGSLFSAGLKRAVADLVRRNMVDVIVSTGANIVDQDFFEALGFRHYMGSASADDAVLQAVRVDRIHDTYIDEDELRVCDATVRQIADGLEPRACSSREFIRELGGFLERRDGADDSVVRAAFQAGVPVFVPAFSDCSAGFGLMEHQHARPAAHVTIDSVKDFLELTKIKAAAQETGLLMIGGGVPKNFAQDCAVGTAFLGSPERAHKYAVQVSVADPRDGGLSGSTLREAHSWGKVSLAQEQMVYCEATIAFPLIAAYAWQRAEPEGRAQRHWSCLLDGFRSPESQICLRHNGRERVRQTQ